ncbi:uncharacterized protein LOC110059730 [Orbicella faveolata]|uniref:uncharacterized protein LOC110059730 n=1 Tax=Orbicella faveolata TaxID=48498 RepID=UPI0009E4B9EB|nr:uncharacterized protein LOC110059730 [Orbicella faveolata]
MQSKDAYRLYGLFPKNDNSSSSNVARIAFCDQVSFAPRESRVTTNKKEVFSVFKRYQEKLNLDVEATGGYDVASWNVAFTMSSRFEQTKKETEKYHNVFYEERNVCNRGRARYQLDLAPIEKFPVSDDFATAVCVLPQNYDEKVYFNFIERWGTVSVYDAALWNVAFTMSSRLEQRKKETEKYHNVFYEEKNVCNRGRARYQLDLAPIENFPVSDDFAAAVGVLPQNYDEKVYFNFIERWGTIENSLSVSGGYMGYKASLKVDMKKFRESMSENTKFGGHKVVFTSGGPDMPEPIGLKLVPIYEAFDVNFYTVTDGQHSARCVHFESLVGTRKAHVKKALHEYPRLKKALVPVDKITVSRAKSLCERQLF